MRTAPVAFVLVFLGSLVLAGCVTPGGDRVDWKASATDPVLMAPPGTPYDGTGMKTGNGTWTIDTKDATNKGTVHVDFTVGGHHYVFHWTVFKDQPNMTWEDGGVKTHYDEHGATGHGNKMEPQLHVLSGGWGTANGTMDGKPIVDPLTNKTELNAHYMLTRDAMLETGTNKIYKADQKTPFDPLTPGDGYVFPNRMEAHFAFWGSGAYVNGLAVAAGAPVSVAAKDTATGPMYSKTFPIPVAKAGSNMTVQRQGGGGGAPIPAPGTQLTAQIKDPNGKVVWQSGRMAPTSVAGLVVGNYTLTVSGTGVNTAYEYDVTVNPPTPLLIHVVFTKVTVQ